MIKAKNNNKYRGFILGTVKREFQLRYQGALLGDFGPFYNRLMIILFIQLFFPSSCVLDYLA